jgi:hypothetical protein
MMTLVNHERLFETKRKSISSSLTIIEKKTTMNVNSLYLKQKTHALSFFFFIRHWID